MAEQVSFAVSNAGMIQAARGSVRDGLAALQNLETLLRSPRIGPRALEQVVGELRSECRPLGDAFQTVLGHIGQLAPEASVVRSLSSYAADRVLQLDAALVRASQSDMGAKARLSLEADVHRVSAELSSVRGLMELLDAATGCTSTDLDVNALISETLALLVPPGAKKAASLVRVSFHPISENATVVTDPRVIMPLISLVLGLVARGGVRSIEIRAQSDIKQGTTLVMRSISGNHGGLGCLLPVIVRPSLDVAHQTADEIGALLSFDDSSGQASLRLPPPQPTASLSRPQHGEDRGQTSGEGPGRFRADCLPLV